MPTFTMPKLGESDVEGTVVRWLKQPGEHVRAEEPLVEVETEKVNVEIPSPFEGTLSRVLAQEGETVPVGAALAVIGEEDGLATAATQPAATTASVNGQQKAEPATPAIAVPQATATANGVATPAGAVRGAERYSPAVLRLAAEHGLDLRQIYGTGMEGRVTRKDVLRFIEVGGAAAPPVSTAAPAQTPNSSAPTPAPPVSAAPLPAQSPPAAAPGPQPPGATAAVTSPGTSHPADTPTAAADEEVIKPSPTRLAIARNMLRVVQTVPMAWMTVECDVSKLVAFREAQKAAFRQREGVDLTYLPFMIKATVEALKAHPMMNSLWRDDTIVVKRRINMGVAVGADDGLVVPVIKDADRLSVAGLAHALADLASRARERRLKIDDVQGGTFTIDNTGVFGSVVSQPLLNPPQCAILTTEAIVKRPVVVNDAIAIRSMMNMCITFDHRIADGTLIGAFMQAVKRAVEAMDSGTALY